MITSDSSHSNPPAKRRSSVSSAMLATRVLLGLCLFGPISMASPLGDPAQMQRSVIAGGGQTSQNGDLQLTGSIGQPSIQSSSNGAVRLNSGFWARSESTDSIFDDGFET